MKAVKGNKVYSIQEHQKAAYLKQGYNIVDDGGKVIEHSPLETVPYDKYAKVKAELEAKNIELEAAIAELAELKSQGEATKTKKSTKSEE